MATLTSALGALLLFVSLDPALATPPTSPVERDCATLIAVLEVHHPLPVAAWPSEIIFFKFLQLVDPMGAYFSVEDIEAWMAEHGNGFVRNTKEHPLRVPKLIFEAAARKARERRLILQERLGKPRAFSSTPTPPGRYGWKTGEELDSFWISHFERLRRGWIAAGASSQEVEHLLAQSLNQVGVEHTKGLETERLYFPTIGSAFLSSLDPHSKIEPLRRNPPSKAVTGLVLGAFAGELAIVGCVPGSPADGLKALRHRDQIVSVFDPEKAGFDYVSSFSAEEALNLVLNTPGESVRMRVYRDSEAKFFEVAIDRREPTPGPSSTIASLAEVETGGKTYAVGVIQISSFLEAPEQTALRVESQLNFFKQKKVDGILLDLRGNPGGSLEEVFNVLSLFHSKKEIQTTVASATGSIGYVANRTNPVWTGPLVVLTNQRSASGAELLAGVVQDFRRGLILGEPRTFGKGTIQTAFPFRASRETTANAETTRTVHITTGYYFLPSGRSPQNVGIQPDIVFPWPDGQTRGGEASYLRALSPASQSRNPALNPRTRFWRADLSDSLQKLLDERLDLKEEQAEEGFSDPMLGHALVLSAEYVSLLRKEKNPEN